MRNKSIIFCAIAITATVLFTNCSKESETLFEGAPEKVYVQVDLGTTKTYMGASSAGVHKMYWSNGDQIAINGAASDELTGLAEDTPTATFAFASAPVAPYNVVYPASIYADATHVTLPAIQSWKDGNFADGMNPMAGYNATGTGNITLHHLCAILKISVKRGTSAPVDEDNLVAVRFKGRNSEQVCGSFTIDYENAALAGASSAAADKEVRVNKNIATSTSEAAVFYIVVPAQTYSSGFDVIVQDQNGHIMTKSVNVSKELEAGHLYNMPEFEFVPTATELGVVIT
ncbi:MAG: fimbrillin family protein, partial [Bacteroidales bacterium]|nr:fimbrillin family protein [Bacteroidales bacterium]